MFFKRQGIPEEGELVICTVKKILFHSVFVTIDEYQGLEGMVHISEVAPGRIRNLRDYVREGKQVICKILRIHEDRGHIDLSLRRVNPSARARKLNEFKQEEKAEKILGTVAKRLNTDLKDVYQKAGEKIIDEYGLLTPCFFDVVVNGEKVLADLNIPGGYAKAIADTVKEKIILPEVTISGYLHLQNFSEEGVVVIKEVLVKALKFAKKGGINVDITYIGAPLYKLDVKDVDFKSAESKKELLVEFIVKEMGVTGGTASFEEKR